MKKVNRCIHIFPRFENSEVIDTIRDAHDTLSDCVEPHITLVFPFESNLTYGEIEKDLKYYLKDEEIFKLRLNGIEAVESHGFYLFLNVAEGQENIKKLHYKLHGGVLEPYQSPWTKDGSFRPHMTIGRFDSQEEMFKASKDYLNFNHSFTVDVDRVYVEIIGENDESIIEGVVKFGE